MSYVILLCIYTEHYNILFTAIIMSYRNSLASCVSSPTISVHIHVHVHEVVAFEMLLGRDTVAKTIPAFLAHIWSQ